jgi:hypothetical protein
MKTVIEMAQEAGFNRHHNPDLYDFMVASGKAIERFAALVAAAENEACAKVCEPQEEHDDPLTAWKIAKAIRARGQA